MPYPVEEILVRGDSIAQLLPKQKEAESAMDNMWWRASQSNHNPNHLFVLQQKQPPNNPKRNSARINTFRNPRQGGIKRRLCCPRFVECGTKHMLVMLVTNIVVIVATMLNQ